MIKARALDTVSGWQWSGGEAADPNDQEAAIQKTREITGGY